MRAINSGVSPNSSVRARTSTENVISSYMNVIDDPMREYGIIKTSAQVQLNLTKQITSLAKAHWREGSWQQILSESQPETSSHCILQVS